MKIKTKFKLILFLVFLAGIVGVGYSFLLSNNNKTENIPADKLFGWKFPEIKYTPKNVKNPTKEPFALFDVSTSPGFDIAYSSIRDPGGIPQGLPVRLKIPVIGVNTAIEDAFITPDGRMDVPAGSVNVAWFALGPRPGEVGSAVIGGHFGIRNGIKFVFYDLDKLVVGDKVYIENDKGETLTFQVKRIQLFDRTAGATTVFTSNDGIAHLNLITCEGIWNRVDGNYPSRRVVFTDAIPTEVISTIVPKAVPTPGVGITVAQDLATFYRTLRIGSQGVDVTALQKALNQVGISSLKTDGSFGSSTRNAVVAYQSSALLPPDGVFGPLSRAKLVSELGGDTGLPNTGENKPLATVTTSNILNNSSSSQTFSQSVKSLFATPVDGIITILLVGAIIFLVVKIIL